jgi:transcriptional regulator with XRE-family HTH domain
VKSGDITPRGVQGGSVGEDAAAGQVVVKAHAEEEIAGLSGSASFGAKLRNLRKSVKKMTLQELAAEAEISPALLSQIERGVTSPSLRTVAKLRTALDLPSAFFFEDEAPAPVQALGAGVEPPWICRANDRPLLNLGPNSPSKQLLHHGGSRVFEFMIVNFPPLSQTGPQAISYPSEKGGYVLEGELRITVDGYTSSLKAGDSFLFDGIRPHHLSNPTDQTTRLLWIIAKLPNNLPL